MTDSIRIQDFPLWDRLTAARTPLSFDLELTARCHNDCRHCFINLPAGDPEARRKELTLPEIERIASEAVELGAFWCLLTGGEPLLRDDFAEIYLALKRKGLLVTVFTTGCLMTDEHVRLFKQYPPRDIEITVYGATKDTYERVTRRPGSFEAFQRGVNRLMDAGVRVRFKAMAIRSNVAELPEIARFCRERTKDFFRFDPVLHLRFDGDPVRNREIQAERLSPAEVAAVERADSERFESLRKNCHELIRPGGSPARGNQVFQCAAGNGSFNISYDGMFRLCSSLWHPDCLYDLRKGSLAEAWRDFVPQVRALQTGRKEFLESCRPCPIANLCLCCPAHAHLECGELDARVQYFCDVAHARAAAITLPDPPASQD